MSRRDNVFMDHEWYNTETRRIKMDETKAVLDMAKEHINSVVARILELQESQKKIATDIEHLSLYVNKCSEKVKKFEDSLTTSVTGE
jgi:predicted  nucleic acid-binding Zn-ribbon protein